MVELNHRSPITAWSAGEAVDFVGRVAVVTLLVYLLVRVPEGGLAAITGESAPYWFAKVLLDVLVLSYVATRSRWTGPKLWGGLWLVYTGLQAVSLVEIYLYGMITAPAVLLGTGRNALMGAVIVIAVVAGVGRFSGDEPPASDDRLGLSAVEWAWKLAVLAVTFLVLMILAGLFVFQGVGHVVDPVALASYELLETPAWIIPFQLVRGVVFTVLLVPVITCIGAATARPNSRSRRSLRSC